MRSWPRLSHTLAPGPAYLAVSVGSDGRACFAAGKPCNLALISTWLPLCNHRALSCHSASPSGRICFQAIPARQTWKGAGARHILLGRLALRCAELRPCRQHNRDDRHYYDAAESFFHRASPSDANVVATYWDGARGDTVPSPPRSAVGRAPDLPSRVVRPSCALSE
jgi:hypothetical protein